MPAIWNIPYPQNPVFTGREGVLTRLAETLRPGEAVALTQPQAISGLGGIGKTQLAVEYAYQHRKDYQAVLWTRADTTEALIAGYGEIAQVLDLPQKEEQDQGLVVKAVQTWLTRQAGWLLILDNADDLALVRPFLPPASSGHLLLTTRAQTMGRLAQRIEVETLDSEMGALLLLRRADLIPRNASLDAALPADVALAKAITQELGGLPLALDQAGAYIEETQCGLAEYQRQYQIRRAELLARRGGLVDDHPDSVATTWSLSFQKVEQANPIAAELLRICAFLAPDAIPEELLVEALKTPLAVSEGLGEEGNGFSPLTSRSCQQPKSTSPGTSGGEINKAIAILRAYSLIQRNTEEKTMRAHRLVQAVVRDALEEQVQVAWITRVICATNSLFPQVAFSAWKQCARYLPQALVCDAWVTEKNLKLLEGASMLHRAGWYLYERAQYAEAEPLYVRALAIREQLLGVSHPNTAHTLNNLAVLYRSQGKYAEAEPLGVRALAIDEHVYGPEHPEVAADLNNLALLYKSQGKYAEAEPLYVRALAICERQLGVSHPNTANTLNNLAILYRSQGKYAEAEPLYVRALAIREQQLGVSHPNTANSLNNLAALYRSQRKYAEAEPLYMRALAICEQQLGVSHPNTANTLNNLATLYYDQGKYEQGEPLYVRALAISEQVYGPEHPEVATNLNNLALLYKSQGKYAEAEPLYQRALMIYERMLGSEHHTTQTIRANYTTLLVTMKQAEEADS